MSGAALALPPVVTACARRVEKEAGGPTASSLARGRMGTFPVPVADGRVLEVLDAGPKGALPLVIHNGTPGAPVAFGPMTESARAAGFRFITYGRPGYGASTENPARSVADAADDTAALLDRLGADRFATLGMSGGGPHALAAAARLGNRCLAAASAGSLAPAEAPGLEFLAGMAADNVAEFKAALAGPEPLTKFLTPLADQLKRITGAQLIDSLGALVSDVDRKALNGELAEWLAAQFRKALERGISGWRDDDLAFVKPWGFDVRAIEVPVAIWQGRRDQFVPYAHGQWLARNVRNARAHLLDDQGHLSLALDSKAIFEDLAALAKRRAG
jgi:pimeloyl-ACP methyl ester carboxylesterase